jgi:hypothetical protein
MILPQAPERYDRRDQDQLRGALQDAITRLEQALSPEQKTASGWVQWTGTASRVTQNADAPPTLTQVAQALKAVIDDLVVRVKS